MELLAIFRATRIVPIEERSFYATPSDAPLSSPAVLAEVSARPTPQRLVRKQVTPASTSNLEEGGQEDNPSGDSVSQGGGTASGDLRSMGGSSRRTRRVYIKREEEVSAVCAKMERERWRRM